MKQTGVKLIAIERQEQIEKHGWDVDSEYEAGQLAQGAVYCLTLKDEDYPEGWDLWFYNKVKAKKDRMTDVEFEIEMKKIAGAFCAAEIDRLQSAK